MAPAASVAADFTVASAIVEAAVQDVAATYAAAISQTSDDVSPAVAAVSPAAAALAWQILFPGHPAGEVELPPWLPSSPLQSTP